MSTQQIPKVIMEEVTDPEELAKARAQDERFERNSAWLQAHVTEVYTRYRGKCICVAGEELFIADTSREVIALADAKHPEDNGKLFRYIPLEKVATVYASMVSGCYVTMALSGPSFGARHWRTMAPGMQSNFWSIRAPTGQCLVHSFWKGFVCNRVFLKIVSVV